MPITINPEWQQLAIYAAGAALLLILLFSIPRIGPFIRAGFSLTLLLFGIFVLMQHAPFDPNLSRVTARLGLDNQQVVGDEVRISMSSDGHFWARATLNNVERRMLIDSGATVTALSEQTAQLASVDRNASLLPVVLRTAGGMVRAETGVVEQLRVGDIEASNLKVVISPALGGVDILGMNFLSQLESWRVEGRTLVLVPGGAGEGDPG